MAGKRMFHTFKEARKRGEYDEYPMLPNDVDPQLHLSNSAKPQPFFLVCEKDTVLVQMTGGARIEFKDSPVLYEDAKIGDHIYVPGGTPHRIIPNSPSVQYRYKATLAGLEALAWYCEDCGAEIYRKVWDTAEQLPQSAYHQITAAFNGSDELRTCACGSVHPLVDATGNNWVAIAEDLSD
jgi:3-hydroxyanthranilate 3,4-dioxygenase